MSRSERLLHLLQILHRHRLPVSGQALAGELGISIRTLYRDIASLQAQGAAIDGAPGVGYTMAPGFMLPPLMFQPEELEALVLGTRWVADRGDPGLSIAARNAAAKIAAVLPPPLRRAFEASSLLVAAGAELPRHAVAPDLLRSAIRAQRKLTFAYRDADGTASTRTVWPFALVYFEQCRVLAAWCELRDDFRNFRADRIADAQLLDAVYPRGRQALLKAWRRRVEASGRRILPETDSTPA